MKKETFLIREKHERITIRYHQTRKLARTGFICDECPKQFEWLTVEEAADISGTNADEIRRDLLILRKGKALSD